MSHRCHVSYGRQRLPAGPRPDVQARVTQRARRVTRGTPLRAQGLGRFDPLRLARSFEAFGTDGCRRQRSSSTSCRQDRRLSLELVLFVRGRCHETCGSVVCQFCRGDPWPWLCLSGKRPIQECFGRTKGGDHTRRESEQPTKRQRDLKPQRQCRGVRLKASKEFGL